MREKLQKNLESERNASPIGVEELSAKLMCTGDTSQDALVQQDKLDEIEDLIDSWRISVLDPSRWGLDD